MTRERPATSGAAYRRSLGFAATERRAVLGAINAAMNAGRHGATTDEVEIATGLPHQSASARMNDLKREGIVETFGMTRRTRSGSSAEVYRLAMVPRDRTAPEQGGLL